MVRGCQKKMVYIKNTNSEVFKEAYFVLTDKGTDIDLTERDMLKEINRILDECVSEEEKISRGVKIKTFVKNKALPFLIGIIIGISGALIMI